MKILKLVKEKDPVLRKTCQPVENIKDFISLASDMYMTMKVAKAIGLAANQVGKSVRIITLSLPDFEGAMFNPIILEKVEEKFPFIEGCLSIPTKEVNTNKRSKSVKVGWYDKTGSYNEREFSDLSAVAIQHEIDHLDGKLMTDY